MAILPMTGSSGAAVLCSRLIKAAADLKFAHPASPVGQFVTVSAGVASYEGESGIASNDIVEAADRALYQAKLNGRNRVEIAPIIAQDTKPQDGVGQILISGN